MTRREPAWRVFAAEIVAATHEEKGSGARVASFLLSPFGAKMNRVLIAGELGPASSVGRDPAQPFWRAPFTDPTGNLPVTAGGFQPRALSGLQQFTAPGPALVLGKVHLYQGADGRATSTLRAEEVRPAQPAEVLAIQAEARSATLQRLELIDRMRRSPAPEPAGAPEEGLPLRWIEGARAARSSYPDADPGAFRRALLEALASGPPLSGAREPERGLVSITRVPEPAARVPAVGVDHGQEAVFLDLVDELSEGASDGYADLREAVRMAGGRGIGEHRVEEILGALEESGVLEEPIVGKLRRA